MVHHSKKPTISGGEDFYFPIILHQKRLALRRPHFWRNGLYKCLSTSSGTFTRLCSLPASLLCPRQNQFKQSFVQMFNLLFVQRNHFANSSNALMCFAK
ncbi:MAG: hypothetical protein LBH86_03930, partial [Oscillospiraceae bacterium]|nr:hypothetical protein [Oscillospiraceae bacterium]